MFGPSSNVIAKAFGVEQVVIGVAEVRFVNIGACFMDLLMWLLIWIGEEKP
jgi:hypothetical protein